MTAPPDPPRFSVVVPVFNEADFLERALGELFAELDGLEGGFEVLLSENGSTDGTAELAESLRGRFGALEVLRHPEPDYGAAMRAGFRHGRGSWRVNFDIDYFSGAFLREVAKLEGQADVVLASKRVEGSDDRRSAFRRAGTAVFGGLVRTLFGSRISDTHGMKAVSGEVVDALEASVLSNRDLFDTELVLRAERAGYRIAEVPAEVEERRATRSSLLRRVPRTVLGLVKLRARMAASPDPVRRPRATSP